MEDLGKYKIVRLIGEGGMGRVYEAMDPVINRRVAIKTISVDIASDADVRARFFREAQAAGQLSHPNLITIHDIGEAAGRPYIVMEYLDGTDLSRTIRGERLPLERKMQIMAEMCEGLAFAHGHDIVHRDIKPANIFITSQGRVKILDFGLARGALTEITRTGKVLGTPHYMAPEQIRGDDLDHRADIFSTGTVLYEFLCGRKAFDGDTVATTIYKVLETHPEPIHRIDPTLSRELSAIVERAMAKDRAERFQTIRELIHHLSRVTPASADPDRTRSLSTAVTVEVPAGLPSRGDPRVNWLWVAAAMLVLAAIGGVANVTLFRSQTPNPSPAQTGTQEPSPAAPPLTPPLAPAAAPVAAPPERATGGVAVAPPPASPSERARETAAPRALPTAPVVVEQPAPSPVASAPSVTPPIAPPPTPATVAEPRPVPAEPPSVVAAPPTQVAPAPAAPREPPAPSAEALATAAIQDVVARYQAALESRDLGGLKRVWPGLAGRQEDAIRTEFQNARAIDVAIDDLSVRVTGTAATAISRRNYQVTTTDGRTLRTATRMTMTLSRRGDGTWTIDAISHEATR